MKVEETDVVIVGSGFAGIVAATILADHRLNLLLVDESNHIGGQLLRRPPDILADPVKSRNEPIKRIGFKFIEQIKQKQISIMNQTRVIGIYPNLELLLEAEEKQTFFIRPRLILFTTGARERFVPFKGWTLPGVYSTGAVQVLLKSSGVLPAKDIIVAGSGLFLFSVAYELLKNGAKVHTVLEQTGMMNKIRLFTRWRHQLSKFVEGGKYMSKMILSGVPVEYRRHILEARGEKYFQEAVTAKLDREGNVVQGSEKRLRAGALAVGYGFVPNLELPQLACCRFEHDINKGGWVVHVDEGLETSVKNIYAAGEVTGIGGALKSINEGKVAALSILNRMEQVGERETRRELNKLKKERKHHLAFAKYFNTLYQTSAEIYKNIPEETVICRCEDVTMGDLKTAIAQGYNTPDSLKISLRTAMGNCQGRTCGPIIQEILSLQTGKPVTDFSPFTVRPPVKPVSISSLVSKGIG